MSLLCAIRRLRERPLIMDRNVLWYKLLPQNVRSKMFRKLKDISATLVLKHPLWLTGYLSGKKKKRCIIYCIPVSGQRVFIRYALGRYILAWTYYTSRKQNRLLSFML